MNKKQLSRNSIRVSSKLNLLKMFLPCFSLNHLVTLITPSQGNKVYKYIVDKIFTLLKRKIKLR